MSNLPVVRRKIAGDGNSKTLGASNERAHGLLGSLPILVAVALSMGVSSLLLEVSKQILFPQILSWQWDAATVAFSAAVATTIALFVLRVMETKNRSLRQSEMEFRAIFEHSALAIAILNPEGIIIRTNPALQRILGRPAEAYLGNHFSQFIHPDEIPVAGQAFKDLIDGRKEQYQVERRYLHENGRVVWVRQTISTIRTLAGKLESVIAMLSDVTGQRQAEEQARLLSFAVKQSPISIAISDQSGNIEYVNPAFEQTSGYSAEEMAGKNLRRLKSEEIPEDEFKQLWKTVSSGREWRGVVHNRRKNGEQFWELASVSPIFDSSGNIIRYLAVNEDITRSKEMQRRLAEESDFNAKIIASTATGILAYKASGECVMANEAAAQIVNATVPKLLKQSFNQLESWRASGLLEFAQKTLASHESRQGEFHHASTFGKEAWIVAHFSIFVRNNEPHLLVTLHDITERKKLEAQLLRSQRMQSLGTLAGGIAHDLNNILTPLILSVHALKDHVAGRDALEFLNAIETSAERGAKLVRQVLIFGRGVRGERLPVQPVEVIREISQIVRETFPKSIEFESEIAPGIWNITGDPTQIHQVLLNLCVNARDAMPNGGKLSIRLRNTVINEASLLTNPERKPGPYLLVSVEDTGVGIPREIQDRIFEPFFTTKDPGRGTGLGLSTTLGIVKSHGGFINCYSEPGKGTVFRIYLPAGAAGAPSGNGENPPSKIPRGRNEVVLLVDDEDTIRKIIQQTLERYGYRVLPAADGAEAVSLFKAHRNEIAVVITDMAMPIMDGPATIAALQSLDPGIKIIGSSGLDSRGAFRASGAGLKHFIPKPFTAETLLTVLRNVLTEGPPCEASHIAQCPNSRNDA